MARPLEDRILESVVKDENDCWLWQRSKTKTGYGNIGIGSMTDNTRTNAMAHRVSYETFKSRIPAGLQIDHLCKVRHCVNPNHLEAVTSQENVHRSNAKYKQQMARTHCPKGHQYTPDNTFLGKTKHGGWSRTCKTCDYARQKARRDARKMVTA